MQQSRTGVDKKAEKSGKIRRKKVKNCGKFWKIVDNLWRIVDSFGFRALAYCLQVLATLAISSSGARRM
jgi:hypothetical protein